MLNTVTEPDDEYLIYDEENISTSTSSHVISDSTSSQVPVIICLVALFYSFPIELGTRFIFYTLKLVLIGFNI